MLSLNKSEKVLRMLKLINLKPIYQNLVVAPLAPPGPGTTGLKLIDSYLQTATYVEKAKR